MQAIKYFSLINTKHLIKHHLLFMQIYNIKGEHIPSGFSGSSISTISSCKSIENNHDVYSGKDCMKKFSKSSREHEMETFYF